MYSQITDNTPCLTGADTVIFLENDFNPFADLQAMDRAHRIGQNRTVNVYRLCMQDSIEDRILELQERKVQTSNAIVNSDNSTIFSMGTDRLFDIFTVRYGGKDEVDRKSTHDDKACSDDIDMDGIINRFCDDYASFGVDKAMSGNTV
jgi:hypothetical protein